MSDLREGLMRGDLKFMLLPCISIDEYASKIDDRKVIVTALFCKEKAAAEDLLTFLEKSPIHFLDTEVSSSPNANGEWACFVELTRNSSFPKKLFRMIAELNNLADIEDWLFRTTGMADDDNDLPLHTDNIADKINLDPSSVEVIESQQQLIGAFFRQSLLENVALEDDIVIMNGFMQHQRWILDETGSQWSGQGTCLQLERVSSALILERMLGPAYSVVPLQDSLVIMHGTKYLILRDQSQP